MPETPTQYNAKIIGEFRANRGRVGGTWEEIPLLLLHHSGARSGVSRVNPVAYLPDDRGYLIWAANGGAPKNPAWYHNLSAQPNTRIEVGGETIEVVAEEATGAERERLFARATGRYPQLAEAARKTRRVIPMIVLTPADATLQLPSIVDRATWQAELDELRTREKAHTRAGDALAAARRKLPMVELDPTIALVGPEGPATLLHAFEGRRQLIAYYFMWYTGKPAAEQCEGCTRYTSHIGELSYLHDRDITYASFCQGPYEESIRYRDFMGWTMPWYSARQSLEQLLSGRRIGMFQLACYLRDGDRVFETYWTNGRGAEAMDYSYALMDLTAYGRQEGWEDSPAGWPRRDHYNYRAGGRPIAQWARLQAGRSDDLGSSGP